MERDLLAIVLRQRWLVLAVLMVVVGGTAVLSKSLPKVYASSSTLISLASKEQTFESVQAGQALARSYADIIDSPLMASLVAQRLGRPRDATEISEAMRFEPLTETQLLKVTGESTDPDDARLLAATYSDVFIEYARRRLTPSTGAEVALAVPAVRSGNAVRPRPTLYVLLAVILGLPLALGLALLRDRLDGRLRTLKDVEERYGLPTVGEIPPRGHDERSQAAFFEAFRVLFANVRVAASDADRIQTLAVASPRRGEGNTTIVTHLALAAAEAGAEVTVIDADLRRGDLQRELLGEVGDSGARPGLSDYLIGTASLDNVRHETQHDRVSLIPVGSKPLEASPPGLDGQRGGALVLSLAAESDVVIIDTPPIEEGAAAVAIGGWAETVLGVVSLRRSTVQTTDAALGQLERIDAPARGLVINHGNRPRLSARSFSRSRSTAAVEPVSG